MSDQPKNRHRSDVVSVRNKDNVVKTKDRNIEGREMNVVGGQEHTTGEEGNLGNRTLNVNKI